MADAAYARIRSDPVLSATYDALLAAVRTVGEFRVLYRKSGVQLVGGGAALAVRARSDGLLLDVTGTAAAAAIPAAAAAGGPVLLTGPDDVDQRLVDRVAAAYRTVTPPR